MAAISTKVKYYEIYEQIKEKILNGFYKINEKLPGGDTLGIEYEASPITIKKSLDILVTEGYIVRRRGRGTFVQDWTQQKRNNPHFRPLLGTNATHKGHVKSEIIHFSVEAANALVAAKLAIQANDFVYKIVRLRVIDAHPSILERTWMPVTMIPSLDEKHLKTSIYQYLREDLGLNIGSSFVNVSGVRPDELEKELMHLDDQDFLMRVEQIAYLDDGRTFEYSTADHLPEKFEFETVLVSQSKA